MTLSSQKVSQTKEFKAIMYRATYRGSKEADILLGGFAAEKLRDLSEDETAEFAKLLTYDDAVIFAWLKGEALSPISLKESLRHKLREYHVKK